MVKIGIIGYSEANGHPYSFSSIINGYNKKAYESTEWLGIFNYLESRDKNEIAALDARVTHVWCPEKWRAEEIAKCSNITSICNSYADMISVVDAVIIARDDYETHRTMAEPFLEAGLPVLIDKPLTLDLNELYWFKSYYDKGLVMSTSGLRFCKELDLIRNNPDKLNTMHLIQASVVNSWEKYGVHMLDATLGLVDEEVLFVEAEDYNSFQTYTIRFKNDLILKINTLGSKIFAFDYCVYTETGSFATKITDNFSSFKRMLEMFVCQVKIKSPAIPYEQLERSIYTLAAGQTSIKEKARIYVNR